MSGKRSKRRPGAPKRVLRLPDLDQAKRTVLQTLGSPASVRAYEIAIDDFISWYCSEPRLAFSKHVVLRYRIELESPVVLSVDYVVKITEVKGVTRDGSGNVISMRKAAKPPSEKPNPSA